MLERLILGNCDRATPMFAGDKILHDARMAGLERKMTVVRGAESQGK